MYQTFESFSFYPHLSEKEKQMIQEHTKIEAYQKSDLIYSPHKKCKGILIVQKGIMRVYLTSESGKKATIYRLRKDEICVMAMSCAIPNITFDVEAEAEENCELLVIPIDILNQISKHNPYIENFIYKTVIKRFSLVMETMQRLLFFTLEQRVCQFLFEEINFRNTQTLSITQEQLADNIGSAREAVARVLNTLKKKNLIVVKRGTITILDKENFRITNEIF